MAIPLVPLVLQVLTETVSLNFASIVGQGGSSCTIDTSGSISGQCISADSNVIPGQVVVSGLTAFSQVDLVISGTNNGQLAFVASADISGGNAYQMILQANVTSNQSHTVNYNVQVDFL